MGCGCLGKKKVEILSKIKEANDNNYNLPNIINHQSSSNLSDDNEEDVNHNKRENNNNSHNNNNNSPQNNNNNNNAEIQSIPINVVSNHNNQNPRNNNNDNNHNNNNNNSNNNVNNINNNSNQNNSNNNNLMNNLQNIINNISEENNFNLGPAYEPYLQSKQDENFNYKEIENEYVGEGVKRMKGYISPFSYQELEKIREDFWSSRIEGNKAIWEVLHTICNDNTLSLDDIDSFMKSSNIVTYKGCINVTYDSKGFLYEIPNYCINDPLQYEKKIEEDKVMPKKENIEIKIRCFSDEGKIKINNYEKVEKLKQMVAECKTFKNKYILEKIRLFFGGKELNNENQLWFYNIENKSIIQMLAKVLEKKKENENNISIISKNQCLKSRALSGVTLSGENQNNENDYNDNLQETFTEQNKLLIKVKNK